MSWENFPGQLIVLMLGWTFTVYLQTRSNDRAEALKRKDKIVDKLDALPKWLEDELKKDTFNYKLSEESYSGHVGQIEIKISQLNNHIGRGVINSGVVDQLMLVELKESKEDNKHLPYEVRDIAWQVIEQIDSACNDAYFSRKGFLVLVRDYLCDFYGVIVAVWAMASLAIVARFFVNFVW